MLLAGGRVKDMMRDSDAAAELYKQVCVYVCGDPVGGLAAGSAPATARA